jgi:hypothetical protein
MWYCFNVDGLASASVHSNHKVFEYSKSLICKFEVIFYSIALFYILKFLLTQQSNGEPSRNFYSTDGEDIVMPYIFKPELIELFVVANAYYARVGAGITMHPTDKVHFAIRRESLKNGCI